MGKVAVTYRILPEGTEIDLDEMEKSVRSMLGSKLVKLESICTPGGSKAAHMLIDITPGSGKFEGRAVLTLHFGTLFLAGAIS